ncbi:MAG: PEGA domain-containing protein [Parvularculaceae bacterium]
MKHTILFFASALLATTLTSGCQTLDLFGPSVTTIESTPSEAQVVVEGYGECETPCTIEHDAERTVRIAKTGYKPQRFVIKPGAGTISVALEISAPTTGVESSTMPEL